MARSKQDETRPKELKPFHHAIAREYVSNGFNQLRAYLAVKPHVKYSTAQAEASTVFKSPLVKEYVQNLIEQQRPTDDITKTTLIKDAARISKKAESGERYSAALKGVELQGRFIGAFDQDEDSQQQYMQVLQKITGKNVTVNIGQAALKKGGDIIAGESEEREGSQGETGSAAQSYGEICEAEVAYSPEQSPEYCESGVVEGGCG